MAYSQFLKNEDIKSFLCVLNKYPRENDRTLDLKVIYKICNKIEQLYSGIRQSNRIELLTGEDFETQKEEIAKRLSDGDKIFVISTYQAIGSGQNLQYRIPEELSDKLKKINGFDARKEKDFDAIYLDCPTNLLVNINNEISEAEFAKYLFQVEFLCEKAEISEDDAIKHVKRAFQMWTSPSQPKNFVEYLYKKSSVNFLLTRVMVQAIGRICRTNMKNKNIYIFVDHDILTRIDKHYFDGRLCNKEFEKLLEIIPDVKTESDNEFNSITLKNNRNAEKANSYILNLIKNEWTQQKMQQWKGLRDFVLKYPTMDEIPKGQNGAFIVEFMYVCGPVDGSKIFYSQDGDYNKIDVSFKKDEDHCYGVSEKAARLDMLMKVDSLKELFNSKGYATEFQPKRYILSPTLFNNIYKGALGEVVGCWLIKKLTGYSLKEIEDEDKYECFDFVLEDKPVYFDMKHWQETMDFDKSAMYEKIKAKLHKCNGKIAVIINILSENEYGGFWKHEPDGITIIGIPYLYKLPAMELNYNALVELKGVIDGLSDKD